MAINNKKLMANYFYIVNKDGDAVLFNLRPEQDTVYKTIGEHVNAGEGCKIIILKARQLGISTFSVMLMLSNAISGKNQNSMMITHKQDISDELFSRILFAFNHLPKELKPDVAKNNSGELVFDNNKGTGLNNKIKIRTASENSTGLGRGETITGILHISEYPQWKLKDKGKELGSILNACSPRAVVIMEATARGYDDFKDRWDKAVSGENGWIPLFFPWFSDPKYVKPYWGFEFNEEELELKKRFGLSNEQLAFRRKVIMEDYNGDVNMFHQEYPSCVTYDTRIGTNKGLIKIGEAKDASLATYGSIKKYIENPVNQIYKLKTYDGYELRGTYEHPIFINDKDCVDLGSLKENDVIQLSKPMLAKDYCKLEWCELGVTHSITIDEKWGKFLGYFMGDGSYSCDTLSIACDNQDQDVVKDVLQNIKDVFGLEAHTRVVGNNKGCCEVRVNCKALKPIFDRLEIIKSRPSDQKIIRDVKVPECIFRSPESVVKAFLSSLFESDGFNDYKSPRVVFFSKHKQFINDVQLLLLACGVVSRNTSSLRVNGSGFKYIANELVLSGWRSYEFNNKIGFISLRKQSKTYKPQTKAATKNEFITKVISVEKDGFEKTYNLTIDEIHEFDANGIHTHNCPEEAFLSSGECIFDLNKINKRKYELTNKGNHFEDKGYFICEFDYDYENNEKKIRSYKWVSDHINGYIKMIQKPKSRYPYVLALDPSGVGDDFNGGHVLNNKTCEQVCTIHKQKLSSFDVACQLYCLGMEYNEALLATEINIAPEIINYLKEFGYTKLYISQTEGTNIANKLQMKYGFRTTTVTRPILISLLIEYINKETHLINDLDTLYEAENFVNITKEIDGVRKTKAQANVGKHDDLLMSLGIALYIRDSNQQTFELLPEKDINDFKPKTEFDRIFGNEQFYEEDEGYMIYD